MTTKTVYVITKKDSNLNGVITNIDESNFSILWEDEKEVKLTNEELDSLLETNEYDVQEVELSEDEGSTPSQKTIATHASADANNGDADGNPKTKIDWIRNIIGNLADMDVTSLAGLQDQILAQVGGEGDRAGLGNNAKGNQASVAMKPSAAMESVKLQKDEMDKIFGESDLSEEFKTKLTTLFETSVTLRLTEEVVKLQEAFDSKLETSVKNITEDLIETMDSYFNHITEEWVNENEVAIESSLRNKLTSQFIDGIKTLFQDHYIDVPDERIDVYESIVADYEKATADLNKAINESIEKDKIINAHKKDKIVAESSVTLTVPERQKFKALIESVDFENEESFKKKIQTIKEEFVDSKKKNSNSNIVNENITNDGKNTIIESDPAMESAVKAISFNKRFSSSQF